MNNHQSYTTSIGMFVHEVLSHALKQLISPEQQSIFIVASPKTQSSASLEKYHQEEKILKSLSLAARLDAQRNCLPLVFHSGITPENGARYVSFQKEQHKPTICSIGKDTIKVHDAETKEIRGGEILIESIDKSVALTSTSLLDFKKSTQWQNLIQKCLDIFSSAQGLFEINDLKSLLKEDHVSIWQEAVGLSPSSFTHQINNIDTMILDNESAKITAKLSLKTLHKSFLCFHANKKEEYLGSGMWVSAKAAPAVLVFVENQQEMNQIIEDMILFYLDRKNEEIHTIVTEIQSHPSLLATSMDIVFKNSHHPGPAENILLTPTHIKQNRLEVTEGSYPSSQFGPKGLL